MRKRLFGVALALSAMVFSGGGAVVAAWQPARSVDLVIALPSGQRPQLTIVERKTGTIEVGDQSFGFVPAFDDGSDSTVTVSIYDLGVTPSRKLTDVRLTVGGAEVSTETKPSLTLSIPRVH